MLEHELDWEDLVDAYEESEESHYHRPVTQDRRWALNRERAEWESALQATPVFFRADATSAPLTIAASGTGLGLRPRVQLYNHLRAPNRAARILEERLGSFHYPAWPIELRVPAGWYALLTADNAPRVERAIVRFLDELAEALDDPR